MEWPPDDEPAPRRPHPAVLVAIVVLFVAVLFEGYYRVTYHAFAFWDPPPQIHWCGRAYNRAGAGAPAATLGGRNVRRVLSIPPLFRPVYAVDPQPGGHGLVCTMELLYDRGSGHVVAYTLSGGP